MIVLKIPHSNCATVLLNAQKIKVELQPKVEVAGEQL